MKLFSLYVFLFLFLQTSYVFSTIKIDYDSEDCPGSGPQCLGIIRSLEFDDEKIKIKFARKAELDPEFTTNDEWANRYIFSDYKEMSFRPLAYVERYLDDVIPNLFSRVTDQLKDEKICLSFLKEEDKQINAELSELESYVASLEFMVERLEGKE